ncbi:MAG: DNA double-strand break repair nuclease NurA [Candidatus Methanodesulfokora sp.]
MEEIEWLKLPHDLQYKFFEEAERESERIVDALIRLQQLISDLKSFILSNLEELGFCDKEMKVAAVDGSRSPRLSERLGVRYGVFSVGAVILLGRKRIKEEYQAGQFKRKQAFSQDVSRYFLSLLATYAERKMAFDLLKELEDGFLIIDGSFYGFIYSALGMRKQGLFGDQESDLFNRTCNLTEELIKSGRVIGVIKRSHTRAIGGFLALKNRNFVGKAESPVTIIDKLLLSAIMPERTLFRYERITGDDPVYVYTQLAYMAHRGIWDEDPIKTARERAYAPYRAMGIGEDVVKKLRRMQVKSHADAPVCEIEYPATVSMDELKMLLGQKNFFNEATGLPFALDIVDSLISLDPRFTDEYVSEVEARALNRIQGKVSAEVMRWFFDLLNPQKST